MAYKSCLTNSGLAIITQLMTGAGTVPKWIGWGVSGTEAAVTQTALVDLTGVTEARTVGVNTQTTSVSPAVTNDTLTNTGTITCAAATLAITEYGIFDALTDGNLYSRSNFAVVNVSLGETIQFITHTTFSSYLSA
jgi:hypothetical protein